MIYSGEPKKVSNYQAPNEVMEITRQVQKDYDQGVRILQRPWVELNNRSVIDDESRGQYMFNAFVEEGVEDPAEAWKWRGTRSMARNKGIAMHANLTANYLLPLFTAQNENDEVDQGFSEVMREIIEWMAMPTNSDYQSSFLQIVFGALTNPVTFLGAEYCEVYQTIKEKTDKGYNTKEVVDEVLSGFKAPIWSSSQVLITNAYERNIQKQRCIIKRRYVEKSELEAKYGEHHNWAYVKEGVRSIYSEDDGLFYDIYDQDHPHLVAEETYLSRRGDTEICFLNGVYFGDENVDDNPIKHRDNRNAPKYNVVPFGYHRIGEHFFYYKSMMNAVGWDNMLYDSMSEIVMNNAILEQDPPTAISGVDKIDSDINFPGAVVAFQDKDTKAMPIFPAKNFVAGFNALRETEKSITEGSVNETISGQLPDASQKAYSVAQAQSNAKKLIGATAKSIAESVTMYGDLMKDIALNHITAPQVNELLSGQMKLKYRELLLPDKTSGGKRVNKRIKFDESLIGMEMTDKEKENKNLELLESTGYPEHKESLLLVNPELFAKFKYLCRADVEEMFTKNQEYWQPVLTNLYSMLRDDPYTDAQQLHRRLMYSYFQGGGAELTKEPQSALPAEALGGGAEGANQFGEMVKAKQLSPAVTNAGVL